LTGLEVDDVATRGRATGRTGHSSGRGHRPGGDTERRVTGGPTRGDLAAHKVRLHEVIEPLARSAGYDLEDLSVVRMGRRYVVRVTVDRDGGVGLEAVANLSHDISHGLDAAETAAGEFISGEYQLEVSSPGTDRPLTEPRHWRRNVGRLVNVRPAGRPVTGRVVAADDSGATLAVDGVETTYPYAELGRGRIEVEFARLDDTDDDDMIAFSDDGGDDERADRAGIDDDDLDNSDARLAAAPRIGRTDAGTYDRGEEDER
jgi:ribosome maturation factor RimP